jgi:Tfp pilus assembly protein PilO
MLLAAVVAVAGIAAYWMLVLSPKREEAASLSKSIATKQGELGSAKAELAQFEKAKAGYKANYSLVARLGKAVPADDDVRSLMVQLNSAAGRSKVDFRSITIGGGATAAPPAAGAQGTAPTKVAPPGSAPVGSAGFTSMPFTFSFKGSYFKLGAFFQRLDRFVAVHQRRMDVTGRLMVLNNISLVPDADGFPNIRASIAATTYMLPTTQESLTAAAATPAAPGAAPGTPAAPGASATPAPGATTPPTTTAAMGATR